MAFVKRPILKYILVLFGLAAIIFCAYVYIFKNNGQKFVEITSSQKDNIQQQSVEPFEPITVLFVGDMMFDRKVEVQLQENGFYYPFEKIDNLLKNNDFVFGNLEGAISKNPTKFSLSAMTFAFDAQIVPSLVKSNFRILSLANNHSLNMNFAGLEETKTILKDARIDWVGDPLACSNDYVVKGNLIFLAFNTTFSECKGDAIVSIIEKIKKENAEKFLVVSMHWGNEYQAKSSQAQKDLAHKIIDSGADLIVGSHPHVVQDAENYNGKMIFYSLGNFVFDQYFSQDVQEGLAVRLEIYGAKILYRVLPIESIASQPQLMEQKKAEQFLKKYNLESIIGISDVKTEKVCYNENCFYVEVVEKNEDMELGLMFRKYLEPDRGMLFVFSNEGKYSFWMKNTLIPLDIIWLDANHEAVSIAKDAQPCKDNVCKTIAPNQKANYVLELNAGTADKINLKIGDKLNFNAF